MKGFMPCFMIDIKIIVAMSFILGRKDRGFITIQADVAKLTAFHSTM
jgi:hypothetical protein